MYVQKLNNIMKIKKKLLIIGTGSIAKRHLSNAKKIIKNQQIFIYSKKKKRINNLINNFDKQIIPVSKINKEIIRNISHAIIASKTSSNTNILRKLIDYPINIYCEKPLADNYSFRCLEEKYLNSKKSKKIKIGFQFRFNPAINFLKKELKKKENKKVFLFNFMCGQNLKDWRGKKNYKKLYSAGEKKYSSVYWELCHEIDLVNYLFGFPLKIYSSHLSTNFLKLNINDICNINFYFKKKLSGQISVEMLSPILYRKLIVVTLNNYYELNLVNNSIVKKINTALNIINLKILEMRCLNFILRILLETKSNLIVLITPISMMA